MNLLLLPDEVKLKIFGYMDGVSKIELSKVCTDFYRLYQDKYLVQSLNFSKNYNTCMTHFKWDSAGPIYSLVTNLNLYGIYWISSLQLRYALLHFKNLTYLNVADTQLSFRDLCTVLSDSATNVTKLGFSLKREHCSDVMFLKIDSKITHLFVNFSSYSIRVLVKLLLNFDELEELWLIEPRLPVTNQTFMFTSWLDYVEEPTPKVKKKIFISKQCSSFDERSQILNLFKASGNWVTMSEHVNPYFVALENCEDDVDLTKFNLDNQLEQKIAMNSDHNGFTTMFSVADLQNQISRKCSYSDMRYTSLNLVRNTSEFILSNFDACYEALESMVFSPNMSGLRRLQMEWFIAYNKVPTQQSMYVPLFKKSRLGTGSSAIDDNCFLSRLSRHLIELEDFELKHTNVKFRARDRWEWRPESLKYISDWKMLKKLTITSIPFNNGKFLIKIINNCPYLSVLKIKDSMILDKIVLDLCIALTNANNLRDLRYEGNAVIPIDQLFIALTNCQKLERVFIQCRYAKTISKKPLETLLSKCEHLVFLFIYIMELHQTVCKTIKRTLVKYDIKPTQIFRIHGRSYTFENVRYEDIPNIHIEDMICQSNHFDNIVDCF